MSTLRSGRTIGSRLSFWLTRAAKGAGRPAPKAHFEKQYRNGEWERLDSLEEMAPCLMVAGYVRHLFASPRVLDVGCGHGRLRKLLSSCELESYVGIDLSSEAIEQARGARLEKAAFEVADFERWSPTQEFDAIVFLDSLYYARDPLSVLRRYSTALGADGKFVISMYRYSNNPLIARRLARHFEIIDQTLVRRGAHQWDIQVLRPPRQVYE